MKKLSILILGLMILGVSACRKVTNEYYDTPNQTVYETLNSDRWNATDGGATQFATIDFLNTDIYQNGFDGVLVYLAFENNVYEPIPQTYDGFAYSYSVTQQRLTIRIQNADGTGSVYAPTAAIKAKIVMIPSQE